jgi:hypothetical protein
MATDICNLTGNSGKFVKAHIIPKAFFGEIGKVKAISSLPSERPRRTPQGQYDPKLVIAETEKQFAIWDTYGIKFMRKQVGTWTPVQASAAGAGFEVSDFDYPLLRLFFLSILWRATASSLVARKADLRGRGSRLKRLVSRAEPGPPDQFAVRLIQYPNAYGNFVIPPTAKEFQGGVCAFSYFGHFEVIWLIKPPSRTVTPDLLLRPDRPWRILQGDWNRSVSKQMCIHNASLHPNAFDN